MGPLQIDLVRFFSSLMAAGFNGFRIENVDLLLYCFILR
jgi:hypothetical protein